MTKKLLGHLHRMQCRTLLLTLLGLVFFNPSVSAQTLRLSFTPSANFVYQLECVSSALRNCAGRDDYIELWRTRFGIDPAQSGAVDRWRKLRRAQSQVLQQSRSPDPEWVGQPFDWGNRMLVAGLTARDRSDLVSRMAIVLPDEFHTELIEIVDALFPAFERWWQSDALADAHRNARALDEALKQAEVRGLIQATFVAFGSPQGARTTATVHLMLRPGLRDAGRTSGQNIGVESYAEFSASDEPAERLSVIVHEYAHFVFGTVDRVRGAELRRRVLELGGEMGPMIWGLFNEVQATAIGNGLVAKAFMKREAFAKYLAEPLSFYFRHDIDVGGKSMMEPFAELFARNGNVFEPTFAGRYVEAVRHSLGEALLAPSSALGEFQLIYDDSFSRGVTNSVVSATRAFSVWSNAAKCCGDAFEKTLRDHAQSVRVLVVRPDHLMKLSILPNSLILEAKKLLDGGATELVAVSVTAPLPPIVVIATSDEQRVPALASAVMKEPVLRTRVWHVK